MGKYSLMEIPSRYFIDLPTDIWIYIITYTNYKVIRKLDVVCKLLHDLINSNIKSLLKEILKYGSRSCSMMELIGLNSNLAAAGTNLMILKYNGYVYTKGLNHNGQLAVPKNSNIDKLTLVPTIHNIIDICVTSYSSLFLTRDGNVYFCGRNVHQMLGLSRHPLPTIISSPTLIPQFTKIVSISSSHNYSCSHTLALREDGCVYIFGTLGSVGLKDIEIVELTGHKIVPPQLIKNINNIVQVATRTSDSLLLNTLGQVYNFGNYRAARKNTPELIPYIDNVIQMAVCESHILFLKSDMTVWTLGGNDFGCLGHNIITTMPTLIPTLNNIIQVSVDMFYSLVLDKDGNIYSFGDPLSAGVVHKDSDVIKCVPKLIPNLSNIIRVTATCNNSFALDRNGDVFEFGSRADPYYTISTHIANIWSISNSI